MQELRLVAVSEDGTYAVLTAPGQGGRFALLIDDRLRIVARGQFSRLAQYEIEVERPLRPKEIQDRIRAGETAEDIADAAGVPIERVRRFEGPVLAERAYRAQEAQGATIRQPGDSGPGGRLGDVVTERLSDFDADPDSVEWDSHKRPDGNWQVQLTFTAGHQARLAEWVFDPRRRHISPADDTAASLCLTDEPLPEAGPRPVAATATVTPIGSRLAQAAGTRPEPRAGEVSAPARAEVSAPARADVSAPARADVSAPARAEVSAPAPAESRSGQRENQAQTDQTKATRTHTRAPADDSGQQEAPAQAAPRGRTRKASGRSRRSSVPSWDEIMFGTSRQSDEA